MSFPASAQQGDSLIAQLTRKWANAKTYTLKMAEMMPEAYYDFKPVPEEMSFGEQLLHIAKNIKWVSTSYLFAEDHTPKDNKTIKGKAAIIKVLSDAYDVGMSAHQHIKPELFDDPVKFFAGPMTRRQILLLLHDHQTHHLGQIIVYLRLKGIKPPDYVGW